MINLYRFLAFLDNDLQGVTHVKDLERDGLRQSVWDSSITNRTVRIDHNREEISEGIAFEWLKLLGYPEMISLFKEPKIAPPPPIINEDGSLTEVNQNEAKKQ